MVQFQKKDLYYPWVFYFMTSLILMILSIVPFQFIYLEKEKMDAMMKQFWAEPIENIIMLQNPLGNCPTSHPNNFFMFFVEFESGCLEKDHICQGYCGQVNKCNGNNIDPVQQHIFSKWILQNSTDQSYYPLKLCYSTIKQSNLYSLTRINKQQCDLSLNQICKVGDSNSFQFCIPKINECPITSFQISSQLPEGVNQKDIIQINSSHSFYANRNTSQQFPLILIQITESSLGGCFSQDSSNLSPGRADYPLIKPKHQISCGNRQDERYQKSDFIIGERTYFQQNNFPINSNLPQYDFNDKYVYQLYYKQYHKILPICWDIENISSIYNPGFYSKFVIIQIVIIALISTQLCSFAIVAAFIKSFSKNPEKRKKYSEENGLKIQLFIISIRIFFSIGHISFVIQTIQFSTLLKTVGNQLTSMQCLDQIDGPLINQISKNYESILGIDITCLIIFLVSIGIEIKIWQIIVKKINARNLSQQQILQNYGIQQIENESGNVEAENAINNNIEINNNNNRNNINIQQNSQNNIQIQQIQSQKNKNEHLIAGERRLNQRQLQDIELSRQNIQQNQQKQMEEVQQIIKSQQIQKQKNEQILKEQELLRMVDFREFPVYQIADDQLTGPKVLAECVVCLENDPPPLYTKCCYQPLHDKCNLQTLVNCPCCRFQGRPKLEYFIRKENRAFKQIQSEFEDFQ